MITSQMISKKCALVLFIGLFSLLSWAPLPKPYPSTETNDVILIGGGVMSGTLGTLLRELDPELTISVYERLDEVAQESSAALNNAGTGHAGYCELNYTPENEDGTINPDKAITVNQSFEISRQFWTYLVNHGKISNFQTFLNSVPHISFVTGEENIGFLKKRYETLWQHPSFQEMEYSEDPEEIKSWIPLVMQGRNPLQRVAATRVKSGNDVNFGSLTQALFSYLNKTSKTEIHLQHEVQDLWKNEDSTWSVDVKDLKTGRNTIEKARFLFIGAGGATLPLLQKSKIPEANGYGGFPVGGQWLVTTRPDLVEKHHAKVYGKAAVGTPPMSVPHLDTRVINGRKALLFGPFAIFSTKYLKQGSWLDLPGAINGSNILPMIQAGLDNIPLTQYLLSQLTMSPEQRLTALREYVPNAQMEDWKLQVAGQRVQVIKVNDQNRGYLQFGTEIVGSQDGSLISLLGASPGASTSTKIMLDVIHKAFPERVRSEDWKNKLNSMVPSYRAEIFQNLAQLEEFQPEIALTL